MRFYNLPILCLFSILFSLIPLVGQDIEYSVPIGNEIISDGKAAVSEAFENATVSATIPLQIQYGARKVVAIAVMDDNRGFTTEQIFAPIIPILQGRLWLGSSIANLHRLTTAISHRNFANEWGLGHSNTYWNSIDANPLIIVGSIYTNAENVHVEIISDDKLIHESGESFGAFDLGCMYKTTTNVHTWDILSNGSHQCGKFSNPLSQTSPAFTISSSNLINTEGNIAFMAILGVREASIESKDRSGTYLANMIITASVL